jgi:hypothetical protein
MKNVGVLAAMTIATLGSVSDVAFFFNSVVAILEGGGRGSVYPIVTDRLYMRSMGSKEMEALKAAIADIHCRLEGVSVCDVDVERLGLDNENTRLDLNCDSLGALFSPIFRAVLEAVECTSVFFEEFEEEVPLRIGFTDAPDHIFETNRSDEAYEQLSNGDAPFWLR